MTQSRWGAEISAERRKKHAEETLKFSYNWIRELVDGLDSRPRALERLITLKTAECEGIEPVGELLAALVLRAWNRWSPLRNRTM